MNLKRLMAILLPVLFIRAGCAAYTDEPLKRVECTVEIMPDYIWHLFAISNLWDNDNSPYGEKYGYSVPAEDISFLHQNRDYIIWGHGRAAEFTRLLFFIPFSHEISPDEYFAYLDNIQKAAGDGDWLSFLEKKKTESILLFTIRISYIPGRWPWKWSIRERGFTLC